MINTNKVVPVEKIDLLTLYGNVLNIAGKSITAVAETGVTSGSGNMLAKAPVTSFDFGASVTAAVLYFIPAYDYVGFSIAGTAVEPESGSAVVDTKGVDLYTATLADGKVTIASVL